MVVVKGICGLGTRGIADTWEIKFPESFLNPPQVKLKEETSNCDMPEIINITNDCFCLQLDPPDMEKYYYWRGQYEASSEKTF